MTESIALLPTWQNVAGSDNAVKVLPLFRIPQHAAGSCARGGPSSNKQGRGGPSSHTVVCYAYRQTDLLDGSREFASLSRLPGCATLDCRSAACFINWRTHYPGGPI